MSTTTKRKAPGTTAGRRKAGSTANPTVTVGDQTYTIERPSGRKADQALALLRAVSRAVPEVQTHLATFREAYAEQNAIYLTPPEARVRWPGEVIRDAEGEPLMDGSGRVRMTPSPVNAITAEDWAAADNRLKLRGQPSTFDELAAAFDLALEHGQEHVLRLLALFLIPNATLKDRRGDIDEVLDEHVDALLDDGYLDEWIELAVVVAEVVDRTIRVKVDDLGERMGNVLRLVGMAPPPPREASPSTAPSSPDGPLSSTHKSSTDSPEPTGGEPTP